MILHPLDYGILIVYLLAILGIGSLRKSHDDAAGYMLIGRKLSLPAFVMTLVSTWYGGILGVSEFSFSYGISNWVIFGLPYYVFGIAFSLGVAKRARNLEVSSLPEIMVRDYGEQAGRLAAFLVLLLANPAPYILTLGILLNYFLGLSLTLGIIVGTLFSLLYILRGGFASVVNTDKVQFILMFLGFLVIIMVLSLDYKTPFELWQSLPPSHRSLSGGHSFGYILVWFFIGSWTLVDPGFHQRVYATTTASVAKRGILVAVGFWFVFDVMTTLTGLYAFAYLSSNTVPSQAFLVLGHLILPVGLQGLFYIGIMATVMSTLDSNALISGITLGKDILAGFPTFRRYKTESLIKIGMLVILLLGVWLAISLPSVIDLWYTFGTIAIPGLLIPTLTSIFRKPMTRLAAILNLAIAPFISWLWFLFGKVDAWSYFLGIEPFYPGMLSSVLILVLSNYWKRKSTRGNITKT